MRKLYAALLILLGLASAASAQQSVTVPATMFTTAISISTATTTRLITGVAGKTIYVTQMNVEATGSGNIQFVSGTGATCGTGTANVTGNYAFTAQSGLSVGVGNGAVWVLPAGVSLCATTSAAVGMVGSIAYAIF